MSQNPSVGVAELHLTRRMKFGSLDLKYENLSNFYCWCVMISHTEKDCEKWLVSKGTLNVDQ